MSFKDMRDLVEHLKLLGFPNMFPLQALSTNFGSLASFHIVAEVLQYLAALLEPGAVLPGAGVLTEEERILLIRSATEFFVTKAAIKLNPRKLYAASAVTASELQKITRLLIAPTQTENDRDEEENYRSLNQVDIGDKMDDLRHARELSSDMTQRGAVLYDLLSKETANKAERLAQANRPMELASVERTLKNAVAAGQLKLQSNRAQLESARVELNALNSKLQRKRAELERTKQRLDALQKIRPAHMQEFEECEKELQELFQKYFLRLHVRDALRAQLEARTKRHTPAASPILQKPSTEGSSMQFIIPEGLIEYDEDDNDDGEAELGGNGGGGRAVRREHFGLDAEIPDIRDEDMMLRHAKGLYDDETGTEGLGKRSGTAISRLRPTTGRSRNPTGGRNERAADSILSHRQGAIGGDSGAGEDDDSSFGSSNSDLDVGGLMGMVGGLGASGVAARSDGAATGMGVTSVLAGDGVGDDDFDLNSMEDISISKITGELPMRPKTASKPEHHSDEDF